LKLKYLAKNIRGTLSHAKVEEQQLNQHDIKGFQWNPSTCNQLFWGLVTSMIQCGARSGAADVMNVFQSARVAGEKTLVPFGQLFLSLDRRTSLQFLHATMGPAV